MFYVDPDGLRWAQVVGQGGVTVYRWFDHDKKDANGQTEYNRAIAAGWYAVTFDESKARTIVNGFFAPGATLTLTTLNPDGSHETSTHTVTKKEYVAYLLIMSALGRQVEAGLELAAYELEGFPDPSLPQVPGPAPGAGSTFKAAKFERVARQAEGANGPRARNLLEKLAKMAGLTLKPGGNH